MLSWYCCCCNGCRLLNEEEMSSILRHSMAGSGWLDCQSFSDLLVQFLDGGIEAGVDTSLQQDVPLLDPPGNVAVNWNVGIRLVGMGMRLSGQCVGLQSTCKAWQDTLLWQPSWYWHSNMHCDNQASIGISEMKMTQDFKLLYDTRFQITIWHIQFFLLILAQNCYTVRAIQM